MRDRTADLLRARQALSQLSYSPIQLNTIFELFSFRQGVEGESFSSLNDDFHNAVSTEIGWV